MSRIVADLGNSRLKWALVGPGGGLVETVALATDDPSAWDHTLSRWGLKGVASDWAISTVNPPVAERLREVLERAGGSIRWFRSAADVPTTHRLERPESAGADRALAVWEAIRRRGAERPGLVVSCGTALTVERVAAGGTWEGGAIAPGLGLSARALNRLTAQLPLVEPREPPPPWGTSTVPALEAGLFWGTIGALRELIARVGGGFGADRWLVWTGGDAGVLAPAVAGPSAEIVPDLVLDGLARLAFPTTGPSDRESP